MTSVALSYQTTDDNVEPFTVGLSTSNLPDDWNDNPNVLKIDVGPRSRSQNLDLETGPTTLYFYSDVEDARSFRLSVGQQVYTITGLSRRSQAQIDINISKVKVYGNGLKQKILFGIDKGRSYIAKAPEVPGYVKDSRTASYAVSHKYALTVTSIVIGITSLWFAYKGAKKGVPIA